MMITPKRRRSNTEVQRAATPPIKRSFLGAEVNDSLVESAKKANFYPDCGILADYQQNYDEN